jgi:hypothetical protein
MPAFRVPDKMEMLAVWMLMLVYNLMIFGEARMDLNAYQSTGFVKSGTSADYVKHLMLNDYDNLKVNESEWSAGSMQ